MADFKPTSLDRKWQQQWAAARAFEVTNDPKRPKFYCLEMFAYPSGYAHVGHVRNYIIGDVMARMKRMRGFNVLHPFGWDAFGLPAENAAIKTGTHPRTSTLDNIAHMRGQLHWIGRSDGARITFPVAGGADIDIFTTRIDTIYGATFVLLSPEHPMVDRFAAESPEPAAFRERVAKFRALDREARLTGAIEKEGFDTGRTAVNPFSKADVPTWI